MDDLPELPFKKVLSYLSLKDRLKLSTVSRSCHQKIHNSRVNSLCYSERPIGRILGKSRWVSGAFAENFISSIRFESFFNTYRHSVLSTLKHLRLCDLELDLENRTAFSRTLKSFGQLEQLDIIRAKCNPGRMFKLTLPMLTSIHLQELTGIKKLTLDASRLTKIRALVCPDLRLDIVHCESVESLIVNRMRHFTVKNLRNLENLRYLCIDLFRMRDSTFLPSLKQLEEIHTDYHGNICKLFYQKQRYGRADLKIYLTGLLLNRPDDPAINAFRNSYFDTHLTPEAFVQLAENPSRLADEIPFDLSLYYSAIERVAPGLEADILKRFGPQLNKIKVDRSVQDIERFLNLLRNLQNIVELEFRDDQPQELFDRLPEHCALQSLIIRRATSASGCLFLLKHLTHLDVGWSIDREVVRKAFEELPVLSKFTFQRANPNYPNSSYHRMASIEIERSKQFTAGNLFCEKSIFPDLDTAIEFIFGKANDQRKRKVDELE